MKEQITALDTELPDSDLAERAKSGDRAAEEALVLRYGRLVRACARPLFLMGGDSEDLVQEGMMGLLTAIREFDPAARFPFAPMQKPVSEIVCFPQFGRRPAVNTLRSTAMFPLIQLFLTAPIVAREGR